MSGPMRGSDAAEFRESRFTLAALMPSLRPQPASSPEDTSPVALQTSDLTSVFDGMPYWGDVQEGSRKGEAASGAGQQEATSRRHAAVADEPFSIGRPVGCLNVGGLKNHPRVRAINADGHESRDGLRRGFFLRLNWSDEATGQQRGHGDEFSQWQGAHGGSYLEVLVRVT